jgi:hypothetical protein
MKKYTFKNFLSHNWWFLLLAFAKFFNQKESIFGASFLDLIFLSAIILLIMFVYWFVRYGQKQNNNL